VGFAQRRAELEALFAGDSDGTNDNPGELEYFSSKSKAVGARVLGEVPPSAEPFKITGFSHKTSKVEMERHMYETRLQEEAEAAGKRRLIAQRKQEVLGIIAQNPHGGGGGGGSEDKFTHSVGLLDKKEDEGVEGAFEDVEVHPDLVDMHAILSHSSVREHGQIEAAKSQFEMLNKEYASTRLKKDAGTAVLGAYLHTTPKQVTLVAAEVGYDEVVKLKPTHVGALVALKEAWGSTPLAFIGLAGNGATEAAPSPGIRNMGVIIQDLNAPMRNDHQTVPKARMVGMRMIANKDISDKETVLKVMKRHFSAPGAAPKDADGITYSLVRVYGVAAGTPELGIVVRLDDSEAIAQFTGEFNAATGEDGVVYWNPGTKRLASPEAEGSVPISVRQFLTHEQGVINLQKENAASLAGAFSALSDGMARLSFVPEGQVVTVRDTAKIGTFDGVESAIFGVGATFTTDAKGGMLVGVSPEEGYRLITGGAKRNAFANLIPASTGRTDQEKYSIGPVITQLRSSDGVVELVRAAHENKVELVPMVMGESGPKLGAYARYGLPSTVCMPAESELFTAETLTAYGCGLEDVKRVAVLYSWAFVTATA